MEVGCPHGTQAARQDDQPTGSLGAWFGELGHILGDQKPPGISEHRSGVPHTVLSAVKALGGTKAEREAGDGQRFGA